MAQGSHKTYGGWEKRTCDRCGEKLTLSGPACLWGIRPKTRELVAYHLGPCPNTVCKDAPNGLLNPSDQRASV